MTNLKHLFLITTQRHVIAVRADRRSAHLLVRIPVKKVGMPTLPGVIRSTVSQASTLDAIHYCRIGPEPPFEHTLLDVLYGCARGLQVEVTQLPDLLDVLDVAGVLLERNEIPTNLPGL